jgi:hypothetical protein
LQGCCHTGLLRAVSEFSQFGRHGRSVSEFHSSQPGRHAVQFTHLAGHDQTRPSENFVPHPNFQRRRLLRQPIRPRRYFESSQAKLYRTRLPIYLNGMKIYNYSAHFICSILFEVDWLVISCRCHGGAFATLSYWKSRNFRRIRRCVHVHRRNIPDQAADVVTGALLDGGEVGLHAGAAHASARELIFVIEKIF